MAKASEGGFKGRVTQRKKRKVSKGPLTASGGEVTEPAARPHNRDGLDSGGVARGR